ncbi:MAG: hypothetical protein ACTFAL_10480 [Candidatus Electronema sp. V4]|uniref:hypothetical protein n=1 Tax=Candidatus Electronema sp. V4 TaxID=3454756 RepID=UPI0040553E87
MKRIFLFLLILVVLADAMWLVVIRPSLELRELARLPSRSELATARRKIAASAPVRQFLSGELLRPQPLEPTELVPEDALLLIDAADAAAAGRTFLSSRFGRTLKDIRWAAVLDQLDVPPLLRKPAEEQLASLQHLLVHPLLQEAFSQRTVLALLPPEPEALAAAPLDTLLTHALLLTAPPSEGGAAFLDLLKAEKKQPDVLYHHGMGILVLELDQGRKLHAALVGGQIALSLGLEPVQQSIDLFIRHFIYKRNGLAARRDYAELKQEAGGCDDFFLYADLARLKALFAGEAVLPPLEAASGARSMALFHRPDGEAAKLTTVLRFAPEELRLPLQKKIYSTAPVANRTLAKMPASLLLYVWSGWLQPDCWRQSLIDSGRQETTDKTDAWFKAQTGLSFGEILSLFGREFSVNIAEISTTGLFPVPRLCFVVEVRERKKAERFLSHLLSGLPVKREQLPDGVTLVSLQAAKGMLQPAYAFADSFLYLADSREQLVAILAESGGRMQDDRSFQAVDTGRGQPGNLLIFARAAELAEGLKEMAAWAGTMIAVRSDQAGEKSKVLIDQVVMPLLDSLGGFEAVSLRSFTRSGELVLEAAALTAAAKQPELAAEAEPQSE